LDGHVAADIVRRSREIGVDSFDGPVVRRAEDAWGRHSGKEKESGPGPLKRICSERPDELVTTRSEIEHSGGRRSELKRGGR